MEMDLKALKGQGFLPQKQEGRFSVRLKVVGGRLGTAELKAVTEAADRFGSGHIHLTSRQSLEIPNVAFEDLDALKETLAAGGAQSCVLGPKVRSVNACQGFDTCKWGLIQTQSLAEELTARYYGRPLPAKFKLGVTGCRNNCLKVEENDLGVKGGMAVAWDKSLCKACGECPKVCRGAALKMDGEALSFDPGKCVGCGRCVKVCPEKAWTGAPGYNVYFGGNFGNGAQTGRQLLPLIGSRESLIKALDAAVDFFAQNGRPGQRFRSVVESAGWEALAQKVSGAMGG